MVHALVLLVVLCVWLDTVAAGEYCFVDNGGYTKDLEWCSYGCCGTHRDYYCCVPVGAIVGGIVGVVVFVSIVVIVVCICKKKSRPGHIIRPTGGATVIMTSTQGGYNMAPQQFQPGYQPQPQPQPPGYGGNPAYPPPYPGTAGPAPPSVFEKQ